MTLLRDIPTRVSYAAPGGQKTFSFPFRAYAASYLFVTVNGEPTIQSDPATTARQYTIATDMNAEGGSITFGANLQKDDYVVIQRLMPLERVTQFPTVGPVATAAFNREFDRMVALIQQVSNQGEQYLRVPAGDGIGALPSRASREAMVLGFLNGLPVAAFSFADIQLAINNGKAALGNQGFAAQIQTSIPLPMSITQTLDKIMMNIPYTPEQFGAVGNGIANDAPAIQKAFDAILASGRQATLRLTQGKRYKCTTPLTMSAQYVNLCGNAMLDFSSWTGTYIRVFGSLTEVTGSYGYNGSISGQVQIKGSGEGNPSIGILFDSDVAGSNTHLLVQSLTIWSCGTGVLLKSRAYNSEFYNCKMFACGICIDWATVAEDNDERLTVFGGTYYNGTIAFRNGRPAGCMYIFSASIDYNQKAFVCNGGKIQAFGTHIESNRYIDSPFECNGPFGSIEMFGGWLLQQSNAGGMTYPVNVAADCLVAFHNVITNNFFETAAAPNEPITWATGAGRFEMYGTNLPSEFAGHPMRMMTTGSRLADGDFDEPTLGADTIFRLADTSTIIDRYGLEIAAGQGAPNITVERSMTNMYNGTGCLRVNKAYGTSSVGELCLMMVPIARGEKAMAGFKVRVAPDRPGTAQQISVSSNWVKSDGNNKYGVPIINKRLLATEFATVLTPGTAAYEEVQPWNGAKSVTPPKWATHYMVSVNFVSSFQASFLFDRLHMDVF